MKRAGRYIIFYGVLFGAWALLANCRFGHRTCFPLRGVFGTSFAVGSKTTRIGSLLP